MNASDLARAIWGTTQDYRGYTVAKNRDRALLYIRGQVCPSPENLVLIAQALGFEPDELSIERPLVGITTEGRKTKVAPDNAPPEIQIVTQADDPSLVLLSIRKVMSLTHAVKLVQTMNDMEPLAKI